METIYKNTTNGITTLLVKYNDRHYEVIQRGTFKMSKTDNYGDANREYNRLIGEVIKASRETENCITE